jgi:hypothetical protein
MKVKLFKKIALISLIAAAFGYSISALNREAAKLCVIVDYNLSRVEDVRIMTKRAKSAHGLTTVLIRAKAGALEKSLADHVIDLDPLAPDFAERAVTAIRALGTPVAVLPFSDNAVASGARVGELLGLAADSSQGAAAAFSKIAYRQAEEGLLARQPREGVMAPAWQQIYSLPEAAEFYRRAPKGFIIKPSCEGNNRGVVKIMPGDDVAAAFAEVAPYLAAGALCEEYIDFPEEYSYDGIGELSFITKKSSAEGKYPVEYGQTVPARLPAHLDAAIRRAGALANEIVGQRIGPFHNEIKLDPRNARSGVIEPNRRPAGMRIWHLARKVYGIDFFELWVDTMLGAAPKISRLEARGTAAIRMLAAPRSGRLKKDSNEAQIFNEIMATPRLVKLTKEQQLEWSDFKITAAAESMVSDIISDNGKFIAQVSVYAPNETSDVNTALDLFAQEWSVRASTQLYAPQAGGK